MNKVKEGYKVYEFGEIPNDWEIKKIGDIFNDLRAGSTPSRKIEDYYTGDIPWITSGELKYKIIYDTLEKITEDAVKDTNLELYPEGTFFIAITGLEAAGTRGSCAISGVKATTNQSCMAFKPKDKFSNAYLYHWYRLYGDYIGLKYTQGTKQQSLNNKIVAELEIPVPKLEEQEKIASILSTVDEQIENVDELIKKNKELKKGLMQQLLTKGIGHTKFKKTEIGEIPEGWQNESLGDMVNFEGGTQPPKKYFSNECLDGMIRLIQIRDYKSDQFKVYVPKELCRRFCDKNDVMIGRYGPPIFQILRGLEGAYNVALIKATPINESLDREYLYYFLNNEKLFNLIDSLSQRTSGQTGIDMEVLKAYKIPIPTKEEQGKIVSILSQIDKKIESYKNKKQKLEELKIGLMQQLLTGKIRVN